jgi:glycerol-3-phosphate acyltransferase PlsY
MNYLIFGLIAYFLGSIPTAVWIGRMKYGIDVREHGSKNAGATNTFRVLGKKAGITVLIIDIIKGFLAAFLPFLCHVGAWQSDELITVQILAAVMAVVGHVFPLFAQFRGGKGVATSLGVIIGIHPPAAGICIAVFLLVFIISQYVSLGAICASVIFPVSIYWIFGIKSIWLNGFSIFLATLVIIAHKKNIQRLIAGNENKMNLFKK